MNTILNRQKQLAEQARLMRERAKEEAERIRKQKLEGRPPRAPAGPLEDVQQGITVGRETRRVPVKIGSRRKRISKRKTTRRQRNGSRPSQNKARK